MHLDVSLNYLQALPPSCKKEFEWQLRNQKELPISKESKQWLEIQHFQKRSQPTEPLCQITSPAENPEIFQQREELLEKANEAIIRSKIDLTSTPNTIPSTAL
jgi:hypothetical protein